MPKLLVLFHSRSPDVIALAEAAADGARRVRFAEVDLRRLDESDAATQAADSAGRVHRTLDHVESITAYDGLILVLPAAGDATVTVSRIFGALDGSLVNKVGSIVTAAEGAERTALVWSALTPMADRGMILVPTPFTSAAEPSAESAQRIGQRVAEVIGWVTHARSHHHHEPHHHDHQSHHHH
jgi:NAD(P)H dehydrogenase (quinone)